MALTNNLITNSLIAHYPMIIKGGKVIDISGNNFHGTPYNVSSVKGKFGNSLNCTQAGSYIDGGSSDFIGVGALTISVLIYPRTLGTSNNGRILSNGKTMVEMNTTNLVRFSSDNSTFATAGNNSIFLNQWQHLVITRTSAGITNFYINGVLTGTANQASGAPIVGTTNPTIGNRSTVDRAFDGLIDSLKIWNRVLSVSEIKKEFNSYAKQINMRECLCYEDASTNVITPKGWIKGTGSYYVSTSTNSFFKKPTKVLTCSVAGSIVIPSRQAYGTWEFCLYKGADANVADFIFINANKNPYNTCSNAYSIRLTATERIQSLRLGSTVESTNIGTNASYIANATWYRFKVTRTLSGTWTVLIKGGSFTSTSGYEGWTLVSTSGGIGTNPYSDVWYSTSNYIVFDGDAGDALADLTLNEGIVQL